MVSKASEDLPEPLSPVMTVRVLRGISTSIFLRLCWRAPRTEILVMAIEKPRVMSLRNVDGSPELLESWKALQGRSRLGAGAESDARQRRLISDGSKAGRRFSRLGLLAHFEPSCFPLRCSADGPPGPPGTRAQILPVLS